MRLRPAPREHLTVSMVCSYPTCRREIVENRSRRCRMHTGFGLRIIRWGYAVRAALGLSVDAEHIVTLTAEDGSSLTEQFFTTRGEYSREDAPTRVSCSDNGAYTWEWYRNGVRHRDGAPALRRSKTSSTVPDDDQWWFEGLQHRTGGPSRSFTNPFGPVEYFYCMGSRMNSLAEVVGLSRSMWEETPARGEALLVHSGYGPLLDDGVSAKTIFDALGLGVTSVEGVRAIADGAPVEWAAAFEAGSSS